MRDTEFFEKVSNVKNKLYRIAYPYFESESMAVDAVDEAIYRGYVKRKQLKEPEYFDTWMVRILINVCNTGYQKAKRIATAEEVPESIAPSDIDNIPLREALRKIPVKYREVVMLKYFGGYKVAEIAMLINVPQGTVATRLSKALKLLRLELNED